MLYAKIMKIAGKFYVSFIFLLFVICLAPNSVAIANENVGIGSTGDSSGLISTVSTPFIANNGAVTDFVGKFIFPGNGLYINQASYSNGTAYDAIDLMLRSTGDGVIVDHRGGIPSGGCAGASNCPGGNAAFNVLIPYYLDSPNFSGQRVGSIVNDHTGQVGLLMDLQATESANGISLAYAGRNSALKIVNQNPANPNNGTAQGIFIDQFGTGQAIKIQDRKSTGTNSAIQMFNFGPTANFAFSTMQNTDTGARFVIRYDGLIAIGPGNSTTDITLARNTKNQFLISNGSGGKGSVRIKGSAATDLALETYYGGSVVPFQILSNGKLQWGPGNAAIDTNLYRDSAGTLKTDGNIEALGSITAKQVNGDKVSVAKTVGSGTILAGQTNVTILSDQITDKSNIFITPTIVTDKTLAVVNMKTGISFDVAIKSADTQDLTFRWWIVDSK